MHGYVLVVADVRLELDELARHLVVGALRQDAQHRPSGLVHGQPSAQGQPAGAAALLDDVAQLHDGRTHQPVLAREAVVLHADVQLERGRLLLVSDDATDERKSTR